MARKFHFTLEPLLEYRKRIEEAKQREWASCRGAVEACAHELDRLAATRRRALAGLGASVGEVPTVHLRLRDEYLRAIDAAAVTADHRRAELEAACRHARDEFAAAARNRRALEMLKERRRRIFEAEAARREEMELDESNARCHERVARQRRALHPHESAAW
jgi:flagellar FliJ protein